MNRVVHFELQVDNPERAMDFYKAVFGWTFIKWEESPTDYWMVMTAEQGSKDPGINGGMLRRSASLSSQNSGANAYVCTMQVDDYEKTSQQILKAGGTVVTAKYALVGMAWQGYFADTEGNTFGVHQDDPIAK